MATDVVVERTPVPLAPIDTDVKLPPSVRKQAAAAEAAHAAAYTQPPVEPQKEEPVVKPPVEEPKEPVVASTEAPTEPPKTPPAEEPVVTPSKEDLAGQEWARRYNSMKGRYDATQKTVTDQQETISQLGNELIQLQNIMRRASPPPEQPVVPAAPLITDQDKKDYGDDLIDLARRAARDAVGRDLADLTKRNQDLQQTLQQDRRRQLFQQMDVEMPDWRQINREPKFVEWLRLRDIYSGGVRQQLLNAAIQAADAPRALAFFKGFVTEAKATGQISTEPQDEQQKAPRKAAVPLVNLTTPGRANTAQGSDTQVPVEKPVFTRAQVSKFYDDVRRGVYAGREQQRSQNEAAIFEAQREGRIR